MCCSAPAVATSSVSESRWSESDSIVIFLRSRSRCRPCSASMSLASTSSGLLRIICLAHLDVFLCRSCMRSWRASMNTPPHPRLPPCLGARLLDAQQLLLGRLGINLPQLVNGHLVLVLAAVLALSAVRRLGVWGEWSALLSRRWNFLLLMFLMRRHFCW